MKIAKCMYMKRDRSANVQVSVVSGNQQKGFVHVSLHIKRAQAQMLTSHCSSERISSERALDGGGVQMELTSDHFSFATLALTYGYSYISILSLPFLSIIYIVYSPPISPTMWGS